MQIIELSDAHALPIERFDSTGATSQKLAEGAGASHVYHLNFTPGGEIGRHPTGFAQLLVVLSGVGWAAGDDGVRHRIDTTHCARFALGEMHAKGSQTGMRAVMIQVTDPET